MGASAYWFHSRSYSAARLVQMLPPDRSSYVYIDVGALRSLGILELLAGAKSLEEADYRQFVRDTGFDYREDLDNVAVAFRESEVYYAAQGRFDWAKLEAYAPAHGGQCERFMCTVAGSEPGRNVTYYMPGNGILAVAVSRTSTVGDMVAPGTWRNPPSIGNVGVWASVLPAALADTSAVPVIVRPLLEPVTQATSVVFTLGAGRDKTESFELRMQATMKDEAAAQMLAGRYTEITSAADRLLKSDNGEDLSTVLRAGKFTAEKTEVTGVWPVPRSLLLALVQ